MGIKGRRREGEGQRRFLGLGLGRLLGLFFIIVEKNLVLAFFFKKKKRNFGVRNIYIYIF